MAITNLSVKCSKILMQQELSFIKYLLCARPQAMFFAMSSHLVHTMTHRGMYYYCPHCRDEQQRLNMLMVIVVYYENDGW